MIRLEGFIIKFSTKEILSGDFEAYPGCITGIVGESGSGKSSLLNVLSLYSYPQTYTYLLNDKDLSQVSEEMLRQTMKQDIAYLRQDNPFLNTMTCIENLRLESQIAGLEKDTKELLDILDVVNLKGKENKYPKNLSGGEKQRLAIAVALSKEADVIICDEVTSSLDQTNTQMILDILKKLALEGKTVILASHEKDVIGQCDVIYEIKNKQLHSIKSSNLYMNEKEKKNRINMSGKYLPKIAASRIQKKKWLFGILWLIASLAISVITFSIAWCTTEQKNINEGLNNSVANELYVYSNGDKVESDCYFPWDMHLKEDVVSQIAEIDGVEIMYPFHVASLYDPFDNRSLVNAQLFKNGELTKTYQINPFKENLPETLIFPYFKEQKLNSLVENEVFCDEGIYLTYTASRFFEIDKIDENMYMKLDVYIPVGAITSEITTYYEDTSITWDGRTMTGYVKKEIELPISGILPLSYSDGAKTSVKPEMYIPYELIDKLVQEARGEYEFKEDEFLVEPSSYKVYLKDIQNRNSVKNEIMHISNQLSIYDTYEDYVLIEKTIKQQYFFFVFSVCVVSVIAVILLLIYSVYHKKEALDDYYFYNIRGLTIKERKKITLIETMIVFVLYSVLSIVFTNILLVRGIGDYRVVESALSYTSIVGIDVFVSIVFAFITESTLLFRKEK